MFTLEFTCGSLVQKRLFFSLFFTYLTQSFWGKSSLLGLLWHSLKTKEEGFHR